MPGLGNWNMDLKQSNASFGEIMSFMGEKKNENEKDWKSTIRNKIENDIDSQVKEALEPPPVDRRWVERKKANRQKKLRNLQIMKLNTLNHHGHAPVFTRLSEETSSERGFKYIDVNYAEKVAALSTNRKYEKFSNKGLPGYDFARRNGLFKYGAPMPSNSSTNNMKGGLDITLLDTSPSSINFLSLPKHDVQNNLRPIGQNVGVITFNGISLPNYGPKRRCFQAYSKDGMLNLLNSRNRRAKLSHIGQGNYEDKRGVVMSKHGPFWPPGYGPVCKCPTFIDDCKKREVFGPKLDPSLKMQASGASTTFGRSVANNMETKWRQLHQQQGDSRHFMSNNNNGSETSRSLRSERNHPTIGEFYSNDNSDNRHRNHHHGDKLQNVNNKEQKWRGKPVIYDCERSSRAPLPHAIPHGFPESLIFESRFESGNLRQVRRIGEFEYELVLRTDMYTKRHTQWYYFRIQNAQRNVTYKFNIINFLKKDSLYNYGMKPLIYSENLATEKKLGWHRNGENIKYLPWTNPTRNGLLSLDLQYYNLEFEVTFDWENLEDDNIYFAHCYPYTYTDLKRHLDNLMADPDQSRHVKREVLCESTAGNACFLLTITEFPDKEKDKYKDFHQEKKGVVVTARVHPGESQASWMMKGVIDFLTSDCLRAKLLRKKFVFKVVPMLNPDGVIVGNYRTSLAARDLNRNYRHPRQMTFPTIWHTKQMVESFSKDHEIILYCDLHGHSRKPMVFMYGCERKALYTGKNSKNVDPDDRSPRDCAKDFIEERLFPWLMHKRSPERFSFHGSKYAVRKCKESTGRVVMFRQFGISNSFTLEASFSGTMQKKWDSGRHFNIEDFLSIGRSLCESVLDYERVLDNPLLKSRLVMELTKDLAQHMMETNPQIMQNPTTSAPATQQQSSTISSETGNSKTKSMDKESKSPKQQRDPKRPIALRASDDEEGGKQNGSKQPIKQQNKAGVTGSTDKSILKSTQETETSIPGPPEEMKEEAENQENEEKSTELDENCFRLLEQINFKEIAIESDTSSDSDSESEPEMPEEQPSSNRQKKKKKRKRRPRYMKSISAPLPANSKKGENKDDQRTKAYPTFVNRYTHRSNGGIPIYAQERMQERAARRLAEMKLAEEEKIRRQNEIMLGKLDENGIGDAETRARYAEVYGIRYQLGNHPNKPQYTLYNPFQDMSPPSGQSESGFPYQTPYRVKHDAKMYHVQHGGEPMAEGSESSSGGSRQNSAGSEPDNQQGEMNSSGEEKPEKIHSRTVVPLHTMSFKFAGEGRQPSSTSLKSLSRDWMTSSYEDKLLNSVKEWQFEKSGLERSKTFDSSINFANKGQNFEEKMSKIDIGADFHKHFGTKPHKNQKQYTDNSSMLSSASPPPHGDVFTPKNITRYEVVIGQTRYPIHIHRNRTEASSPPMITGESILNQKPSEPNSASTIGHKRAQSADVIQNGNPEKEFFLRKHSIEDNSQPSSTESHRSNEQNSAVSKNHRKSDSEFLSKSNGLIFALHKVNVVSPSKSNSDDVHLGALKNTPYPPKRASTLFSPIVKPLSSMSNRRTFSVSTDPDFNINSAR
uniref:uncharacterized protein LOC120334341 isoform X2 n=1 Tax=Styela clava TaxID=7725 RepID=UPI00193ADF2D|nr:uncharacterized protein LOC120334341 isoform X2 [Styela clava]